MSSTSPPRRGEVWLVNFDPTVGAEIKKNRPAVVLNSDSVGRPSIKLVAPFTEWKNHFSRNLWHVRVDPVPKYRQSMPASCAEWTNSDSIRKLGELSNSTLEEIVLKVGAVIEYP